MGIPYTFTGTCKHHIEARLFSHAANREVPPQYAFMHRHIPCVCNYSAIHCNRVYILRNQTKPSNVKDIIRFRQLGKMCYEDWMPVILPLANCTCIACVGVSIKKELIACGYITRKLHSQIQLVWISIEMCACASMASATTRHFDPLDSLHNTGFWYRHSTEIDRKFCILISWKGEA